jgi:CRP-like cAMP-binding protein
VTEDWNEDGPRSVKVLRGIPLLAEVDDATLLELFAEARRREYSPGSVIVRELEPGGEMFVLMRGEAEVSVDAGQGSRRVVGHLAPGSSFGEMAALTGELRSATVTASTELLVLVFGSDEFERLRERRPQIGVALLRLLSDRLGETEKAILGLLSSSEEGSPRDASARAILRAEGAGAKLIRGSIPRLYRELVTARRRELGFLALVSFVATLITVRCVVYLSFRYDASPRAVLRAAYMTGFASLVLSACASLLTFRPALRRWIALLYGGGLALIFNELGVTLAFDIFYKDIHTPDPTLSFDVQRLYDRSAAGHAVAIGLAVLVQAAYLRRFYARVLFIIATRARRLLG